MKRQRVAIGEQLKECPRVITLGERSQLTDYTRAERELLRTADMIFYPTDRFVDLFATLGKETFPSFNCYRLRGNRLKQTSLLRLLNAPHPQTRVYFGHKQKQEILQDFGFPLVAKQPRDASDGTYVFFVNHREKLDWYNQNFNPAYIQEYVAAEQQLRVVVLNYHTVFGYQRPLIREGFMDTSAPRGAWRPDKVDTEAVELAKNIAREGNLSDVAVDMVFDGSIYWVLELNFHYDESDPQQPGLDRTKLIIEMIEKGEL